MTAHAGSEVVTDVHADIGEISSEWDTLADQVGAIPFARPGWFKAWLATFGTGTPMIVSARREGRLVGVLPLEELNGRRRSMANFHSPRFEPLAVDAAAAAALTEGALGSRRLSLSFIETRSKTLATITRQARAVGYDVRIRDAEESPEVAIAGSWDEYFPTVSKNMRREFRRRQKRLSEVGELEFETHDGSTDAEARVREAFAVEARSWKGAAGTAVAVAGSQLEFYLDVANWAAERGWLRICLLRLDGQAIASDFALEVDGVFYSIKGGYDPAFGEYSPGRLMDGLEIQRAHEIGLRRFEFGGDAEHHKLQWRPQSRPLVRFDAFAPTLAGRLDCLVAVHGRRPAKALRAAGRRARGRGTH